VTLNWLDPAEEHQASNAMVIGFVGLGRMGSHMCRHIVQKSGFEVIVFDVAKESVAPLLDVGARSADSLAELCANSELIFTCLPMPDDVEVVAVGQGGVSENAKPGSVLIDLSTNSVSGARKIGGQLANSGISMLDAPVSGGPMGAQAGTLSVMVGGDNGLFAQYKPVLQTFGRTVVYVGGLGCGLILKLVNNMIATCYMSAAAEGLTLAEEAGLDLRTVDMVLRDSSADSLPYRALADAAISRNFSPKFPVQLAAKDLRLALDLAEDVQVPTAQGAAAQNLLRMAGLLGFGQLDATAMIQVYESLRTPAGN
jgi:3-hydroxyisobutyrate dehydrogenase-like beta-hydroxyacid dehydrogenase